MSVRLLPVLEARLPKGARVLDVGCEDGALVKALRERGYTALGFDLFPPENAAEIAVIKHDINETPFPYNNEQFDAVVVSFSFRFVKEENTAKIIYELGRVTKKGGFIFIYDTERLIADRVMSYLVWRYDFWARYGNDFSDLFRPVKRSLMVVVKK